MAGGSWSSRPVFIASAFSDMQAEREILRSKVFPALEQKLRARRVYLEWIDLSVGALDLSSKGEGAREAEALKVSLAEIKRSRPFLIGLVGDRYGWVPPSDSAHAAIQEAADSEGEKAIEAAIEGLSVTELEIVFGALADPKQGKRSLFWLRGPLPYNQMTPEDAAKFSERYATDEGAAARAKRLDALKLRVTAALKGRVFSYAAQWDGRRVAGLDAWAKEVEDKLWAELDAEIPAAGPAPAWQDEERGALSDIADDLARNFVGRHKLRERIIKFIASNLDETQRGLVVTGESGSGKSALWGFLHAQLTRAKGLVLLSHAAGASPRAPAINFMLRRWIEELSDELGITTALEDNAKNQEVERAFASLLDRVAARRRVLILIDALDQFEATDRGRFMTWLPKPWPQNARLIATAIAGEASEALARLPGVTTLPLPPLDADEARAIAAGICASYHRKFEPEVIEALAQRVVAEGARENALWLTLATEALNLIDADEFARAATELPSNAALMLSLIAAMPADISGLYGQSFDRAARLFGERNVWAFLGAIAASRGGWREIDFRGLLPKLTGEAWDPLRFAELRRAFRGQLRVNSVLAQWDFAHGQMREAFHAWARKRNLDEAKAIHTAIGDCLIAAAEDDRLRASETMLHLMEGEDGAKRAALYYGDSALNAAAKNGASDVLAEVILSDRSEGGAGGVAKVAALLDALDVSDKALAPVAGAVASQLLFDVDERIAERAESSVRLALTDRSRSRLATLLEADPGNAGWQGNFWASCLRTGDLLTAGGNLPEAAKAFRDALAIAERSARKSPGVVRWQRDLWLSFVKLGEALIAQGKLPEAQKQLRSAYTLAKRSAREIPSDTGWRRDLSASMLKFGEVLVAQGSLPEALKTFRDGLEIAERLARENPGVMSWRRDVSVLCERIGDVLVAQGNLPEAEKAFRDRLAATERLVRENPGNAAWRRDLWASLFKIGNLVLAQGNLAEAEKALRDGLAIAERFAREIPDAADWRRDLAASHGAIAECELRAGQAPEARQSLQSALAILRALDAEGRLDPQSRISLAQIEQRLGSL